MCSMHMKPTLMHSVHYRTHNAHTDEEAGQVGQYMWRYTALMHQMHQFELAPVRGLTPHAQVHCLKPT